MLPWIFFCIFLLGRLTLLSSILTCNPTFYKLKRFKKNIYIFFPFSIWVNVNHKIVPKKSLYKYHFCCEFSTHNTWFGQKPVGQMPNTIDFLNMIHLCIPYVRVYVTIFFYVSAPELFLLFQFKAHRLVCPKFGQTVLSSDIFLSS